MPFISMYVFDRLPTFQFESCLLPIRLPAYQIACLPAYPLLCLLGWAPTLWRISRRRRHSASTDGFRCLLAGALARPSCLLNSFGRTFAVIVCIRQCVGVNTTRS